MRGPRKWQGLLAVVLAAVAAPSLAPASALGERIRGVDVSRFQGLIDWQRVGETKNQFAFLQASRGSSADCTVAPERCGPDEFYDRNYRRARQVGIRVGPYHRTFTGGEGHKGVRRDARREAIVFLTEVGSLRDHDLLPVLDVETPFNDLQPSELRVWIRTWIDRVTDQFGVRPIIYTNNSSWRETGDTTSFAYAGHPLWIANWKVEEPLVPAANWGGLGWTVWQYRSDGRVPGIDGEVDRNRLRVPLRSISVGASDDPQDPRGGILRLPNRERGSGLELGPEHRRAGDRDRPLPGGPFLTALPRLRADLSPADAGVARDRLARAAGGGA